MVHKSRDCKLCGEGIVGGNLSRHNNRKHPDKSSSQPPPPPPQPVERSVTVSDVFRACGFDTAQLRNWNSKDLDSLPNIRCHQPKPRRHHTEWQVVTDENLSGLPSLEELLIDIAARPRKNGKDIEVWLENNHIQFKSQEWVAWAKRILKGEQVLTRVLNMPMGFIAPDVSQNYCQHAAEAMRQHLPDLGAHGFLQNPANANITPRGTRTEVHHDSQHHISTAIGLKSRKDRPLKLWLLWPSTELRRLASCYGDTRAALASMDHGSFLVQMPGESIIVPPNSPHAVVALESCYLYGHTFSTERWAYEPSTVLVDIKVGDPADEACRARINQLRLGLCSTDRLRQACVDQFIETWPLEAAVFRRECESFEHLVSLWADDARDHGSCAWCAAAGEPGHTESDSREHARAHLEGRVSSTVSTTAHTAERED